MRVFAIEQFHHFAYMAIGVAMLGFGTTGTVLALRGQMERSRAELWFYRATMLTVVALLAAPTLIHRIPVDATQLLWDLGQWPRMALVYAVLALPFAAGALAILLALQLSDNRLGFIYGASFFGSGIGATLSLVVLSVWSPDRALAAPALIAVLGVLPARGDPRRGRSMGILLLIATVAMVARPLWQLDLASHKALTQIAAYPGAERIAERTSPLGWTVAVGAPAFRHAPGLSLAFRGEFPSQLGLFVDAQLVGAVPTDALDTAELDLLDWLPTAAPYAVRTPGHVLVLAAGGGTEVRNARRHGARRVTAVEPVADVVHLAAERAIAKTFTEGTDWVFADGRSFASRTREAYDVITIGPAGGLGAAAAGVHALTEDFLHTVEAYTRYLQILSPDGILAVTRWSSTPPRENVRVILTAAAALRRVAPTTASQAMIVLRSWGTATTLLKPSGFSAAEFASLERWATERQFDIEWGPGTDTPGTRFHQTAEPVLFRAARAAAHGPSAATRFASEYPLDVRPATDARPFPHHFLTLSSLATFLRTDRGSWLPFAELGFVTIIATLLQSTALAIVCLLIPIMARPTIGMSRQTMSVVGYFGAIGLGYLAMEIAAIQVMILLLGHPVYAVVAVLSTILICSGAGSAWSDRLSTTYGWVPGLVLAGTLALMGGAVLIVVHAAQGWPLAARAVVALAVVAPTALVMGTPFPLGLRTMARGDHARTALAWASNGFASVIAAPLAALIALQSGSRLVLFVAAIAYGTAAIIYRAVRHPSERAGV